VPLGAYAVTGTVLVSNPVSSIATKTGGFAFRMVSITERDMLSIVSAGACDPVTEEPYPVLLSINNACIHCATRHECMTKEVSTYELNNKTEYFTDYSRLYRSSS
jgi:hypothetical protein